MRSALCEQIIHRFDIGAFLYDDCLYACCVGIGEVYTFQTIRCYCHACHTHACLTAGYRRNDGIKFHILDFEIHAQLICQCLTDFRIDTDNILTFVIFIRRECCVCCHSECFLFCICAVICCRIAAAACQRSHHCKYHCCSQKALHKFLHCPLPPKNDFLL